MRDDDADFDLDQVSTTAHRAFHLASGLDPDGDVHPAWGAVARHVHALATTGDDDIQLSFSQLGLLLHRDFVRAQDPEIEVPPFADLPAKVRFAWIAVARHLLNVMTGEPEVLRKLNQHEGQIADWAKAQLAKAS